MISIRTHRIAPAVPFLALAALVAGGALPAAAAPGDPTEAAKSSGKNVPAASDKRLYCVVSQRTGSRLEHKECKTRTDWIAAVGIDPAKK